VETEADQKHWNSWKNSKKGNTIHHR